MRIKLNDQAVQELLALMPDYGTSNPSHVVGLAITALLQQRTKAHLSEAHNAIEKPNLQPL